MINKFFITAIGTDVGKTITSAVVCQALKCDYWKPIQAGSLEKSDSHIVSELISDPDIKVHFEKYRLETPCSPHLAASLDNINMEIEDFKLPLTKNGLVVEGAGGLMVPINRRQTVLDLISHLNLPVIVVSKNYLGSINHTLLTISRLQQENINIHGIIFNGEKSPESEKVIKEMTGIRFIARIDNLEVLNKETIFEQAIKVRQEMQANGL